MVKKKIKLVLHPPSYSLIALSCSETLHRICWLINTNLDLQLKESTPMKIQPTLQIDKAKQIFVEFPTYKDEESHPELTFLVIKNKIDTQLLFKELQNIDFLFLAKGDKKENQYDGLIQKLKKIPGVLAAIPINPEKLSNINFILNI
jgi:hypothetical protein